MRHWRVRNSGEADVLASRRAITVVADSQLPLPAYLPPRPGSILLAFLVASACHISRADDSNDPNIQGRALAAQLLEQRPTENFSATGKLTIRDGHDHLTVIPITFETLVTGTNWQTIYQARAASQTNQLDILHTPGQPDVYNYGTGSTAPLLNVPGTSRPNSTLAPAETMTPFAGSDFWVADLGLEFLRWPQQKLLKQEPKRHRNCNVLESTNPHPAAGSYARVLSWIDTESGGLVQAKAYDDANQVLKEFYPKDIIKVKGEWQVGLMEMDNDQTGSRSRLEFDLHADSPKK